MAYKAATPTLQGLPQELLEIVFLHSMNISLPRASPDLGRKLSSKWVCMEYTMRTFFHTVEHKTPIRQEVGEITSDKDVQSELLNCNFYTWPFFLSYVEKAHAAIVQLRGKAWEKTGVAVPGIRHFDGLWPFKFRKIDYLGFAEGFRVPEKLLHGPWSEEKSSLLYVLVSLSGEIDWTESMAGETAKEGMAQAVEEGNERAVAALSVLLGVANAITTEMLRHAVVDCGCDFKILRHLLFNAQILYKDSSPGVLDLHDPVLWQWADGDGEESGKGETLKDMLRTAEMFDLEFYHEDESDWASIVPFPYSGDKFDARTDLDGTTRELLGRLYRSHGRSIVRRRPRREVVT
jgi:large subunit ribosomal protein L14e